jgi:ornithine cyclodeaminase/alanine dehydrogenase-like protein (mu-crystallin family)
MRIFSAADVQKLADYRDVVEALREAFRMEVHAPPRHIHTLNRGPGHEPFTWMLMPAWVNMNKPEGAFAGLKTVMVGGNPTVQANYLLFSGTTGETLAVMDGAEITARRTAAAGALAADYLARTDATRLLMVGAGVLGPHVVRAHASVRDITHVDVYNRSRSKAERLVADLTAAGFAASVVDDLPAAANAADIISCATTSTTPIIEGKWLRPGTHVDLMGAYRANMREVDGETVKRARVFVDTYEGAAHEAGDLIQAVKEGVFDMDLIAGDLAELTRGRVEPRHSNGEITLFKSCGTALEDLATAILIYRNAQA